MFRHSGLPIRHSFDIRISCFVIPLFVPQGLKKRTAQGEPGRKESPQYAARKDGRDDHPQARVRHLRRRVQGRQHRHGRRRHAAGNTQAQEQPVFRQHHPVERPHGEPDRPQQRKFAPVLSDLDLHLPGGGILYSSGSQGAYSVTRP